MEVCNHTSLLSEKWNYKILRMGWNWVIRKLSNWSHDVPGISYLAVMLCFKKQLFLGKTHHRKAFKRWKIYSFIGLELRRISRYLTISKNLYGTGRSSIKLSTHKPKCNRKCIWTVQSFEFDWVYSLKSW